MRSIKDLPGRANAESARFNLYAALQTGDRDGATQWLTALRVALDVLPERAQWAMHTTQSVSLALRKIFVRLHPDTSA